MNNLLCLFSLALFSVLFFSFVSIINFSSSAEPPKSDVAIVLGTKVAGDSPSANFKARIDHAISLYQDGYVEFLLFTGGITTNGASSESHVAKKYAMENGVPEKSILIENESLITRTNFLHTSELLSSFAFNSFLLVSDPHHLKRATLLGNEYDVFTFPSAPVIEKNVFEHSYFLLRETVLLSFYHLQQISPLKNIY